MTTAPEDIKAFRKAHGGISQSALAEKLGVALRSVQAWESGTTPVPPMLWLSLAALGTGLAPWTGPQPQGWVMKVYQRTPAGPLIGAGAASLSVADEEEAILHAYRFARQCGPGHVVTLLDENGAQIGTFESSPISEQL